MRTVAAAFTRLARTLDAGVATRVRTIRKSDGWEVDLTDLCGANWVRGTKYAEGQDNNTATFSIDLTRAIGENTLNPLRASKANRNPTTPPSWTAGLRRTLGNTLRPTAPNGYFYRCTTSGISHATVEPTWGTTVGGTTTDGTAVWTNDGPTGVAMPVLDINRVVVVDVQVMPPDGIADDDNWVEFVRGTIDRIKMNGEANTITLECRDESARFIRAWQEYERNWPETIPQALELVIQAVLDAATYDPGTWVPSVARAVGDLVRPTVHNGYLYRCTTSGTSTTTEPTWDLTPGNTTADGGSAVWTNVGPMPAPAWTAATTKYLGSIIRPTTRNGYMYQCTAVTGAAPYTTHATTEPTWPTTYGASVVDNELTWTLIEDMPDLYTPTSPSWSVTRAQADDYGLPPQSYWDICRAFVDQIGWNLRWSWVDGSSRRRPVLRSISNPGDTYQSNGDLGTFDADQYEVTSDVEVLGEHIRNVVEVVYANGDETGDRKQTRLRLQDSASVAAYGAQFLQGTMDSSGLINDVTEATKLAQIMLDALSRPLTTVSVRVPFFPWAQVGDGIKLTPRPEDALLGATAASDGTFVACVQGVSHNTNGGKGATELQLQGFWESAADDIEDAMPLQTIAFLNREARARIGRTPTLKRPGDVFSVGYVSADYDASPGTKPGVAVQLDAVQRDGGNNFDASTFEFTAPVTGLYSVSASCRFVAPATVGDEVWLSVLVAGSAYALQTYAQVGANQVGVAMTLSLAGNVWLDAGDTAKLYLAFDPPIVAPAVISIKGGDPRTTFMSVRLAR